MVQFELKLIENVVEVSRASILNFKTEIHVQLTYVPL
jgi:hypothetical protein